MTAFYGRQVIPLKDYAHSPWVSFERKEKRPLHVPKVIELKPNCAPNQYPISLRTLGPSLETFDTIT